MIARIFHPDAPIFTSKPLRKLIKISQFIHELEVFSYLHGTVLTFLKLLGFFSCPIISGRNFSLPSLFTHNNAVGLSFLFSFRTLAATKTICFWWEKIKKETIYFTFPLIKFPSSCLSNCFSKFIAFLHKASWNVYSFGDYWSTLNFGIKDGFLIFLIFKTMTHFKICGFLYTLPIIVILIIRCNQQQEQLIISIYFLYLLTCYNQNWKHSYFIKRGQWVKLIEKMFVKCGNVVISGFLRHRKKVNMVRVGQWLAISS